MAADFRAPAALQSIAVSRDPRPGSTDPYKRRFDDTPFWVAFVEFFAVEFTAYLASIAYTVATGGTWEQSDQYIPAVILIGALVVLSSLALGHYNNIQQQPRHRFLWGGLASATLAFSFFLSLIFLLKATEFYSRATFFMQFAGVCAAVLASRTFSYAQLHSKIKSGYVEAHRVLVVGTISDDAASAQGLTELCKNAAGVVPLPDFLSARPQNDDESEDRRLHDFIDECRSFYPDTIIILARLHELPRVAALANTLSEIPVSIHLIPIGIENLLGSSSMGEIGGMATVQLLHPPLSILEQILKETFDRVCAAVGLVLLAPLLIMAAVAIKIDSRGPVLFRQTRHGFNNGVIRVFKFRTMNVIEGGDRFTQASKSDPRITRVGRILRRTNIDELPQLLNVLFGEMSIVGPRPHATAQNEMFDRLLSGFSRRHVVKPGITGWAQVNGFRGETDTLEKMKRRVEYDLYYVDNWSFLFDLKIIVLTLLSKRAYLNAY
jgi:Undecaprenyl-phosphate glucose phosphotransferase